MWKILNSALAGASTLRRRSWPETELLAAIVEGSADAIIGGTLGGVITSWNAGAERIYGYSAAEAVGMPITRIVPSDRIAELDGLLKRIGRGEAAEHIETERFTKSGQRIRVSLTLSPIRDRRNRVVGAAAIARQITAGTPTQGTVAAERANPGYWERALVETAAYGIYRAGADGQFLDVNLALAHMLGYDDCNQLLQVSSALLHTAPSLSAELISACQRGENPRRDVEWIRKDGTCITVRLSARALSDGSQAVMEAIAEDITVQRKLQQLQQAELMGELTGKVVQNIKNYLTVIAGHEDMITATAGENAKLRWHAGEIQKAVRHASELASRLLLLEKKEPSALKELDLNLVVHQSLGLMQAVIRRDHYIAVNLAPSYLSVLADAGELQQALLNLTANARDAMCDGGDVSVETKRIRVPVASQTPAGASQFENYVVLAVTDTGRGMDHATRTRALEPFFSTKPQGKGTGLGLSCAHAIVRRHGGWLDIQSTEGKGTTVFLYIPAYGQGEPTHNQAADEIQAAPSSRLVLAVDGEVVMNGETAEMLENFGFRVVHAPTWRNAMKILEQGKVDLLMCALELPDISAQELSEKLRWLHRSSKIIVLSSRRFSNEERRRFHPAVFLQKPFSMPQLLDIIHAQVGFGRPFRSPARTPAAPILPEDDEGAV